jgi:hypothetical protein
MAKNTGKGYRKGEVTERSQTENPQNEHWTKRNAEHGEEAGQFMDQKADEKPFKGVRKAKG